MTAQFFNDAQSAVIDRAYSSRSALEIGSLAARIAGNNPPIKRMASAYNKPVANKAGVTLNARAT